MAGKPLTWKNGKFISICMGANDGQAPPTTRWLQFHSTRIPPSEQRPLVRRRRRLPPSLDPSHAHARAHVMEGGGETPGGAGGGSERLRIVITAPRQASSASPPTHSWGGVHRWRRRSQSKCSELTLADSRGGELARDDGDGGREEDFKALARSRPLLA